MSGSEVLDVAREAIWLTLQLAAPILLVVLQALTQIQEQTLIAAPKILAVFLTLLVYLPMMGALLAGFMNQIAARIAGM